MKDKKSREQIQGLEYRIRCLESANNSRLKFVIQHCPQCSHDTVQTELWEPYYGYYTGWVSTSQEIEPPYYRCTNCGAKIRRRTKTICNVVNEEKEDDSVSNL